MVKKYFKARKTSKPYVKSKWTGRKRKLERDPETPLGPSEKLGRYTPILASQTTLAKSLGPFTGRKFIEMVYWQAPTLQTTTAPGSFLSVLSNSLFDFDVTGNLGNKQPMYMDTLLTSSGPYKSYKVLSWKTTWTFYNEASQGVNIWVSPPIGAAAEFDGSGEYDDFPGTKKLTLTALSGSKNIATVTTTGHVKDVYPALPFSTTFVAAFSASPPSTCFQNVVYQNLDGSSVTKLYVGVKHIAKCELGQLDSVVS